MYAIASGCVVLLCRQDPSNALSAPALQHLRENKDIERCSMDGSSPQILATASNSSESCSSSASRLQSAARGASLHAQAGALYRKNAVYQRRNLCSNVCLLSAPIFFCLMLLAVQLSINKLLLTGPDFEVRQVAVTNPQRGSHHKMQQLSAW
jgi:hypothetical protein